MSNGLVLCVSIFQILNIAIQQFILIYYHGNLMLHRIKRNSQSKIPGIKVSLTWVGLIIFVYGI